MSERLGNSSASSNDGEYWSILQEHGSGFGTQMNGVRPGPFRHVSDLEAVQNEHGSGFGVPADPMEKMGTREQELLNIANKLKKVDWSDGIQEDIDSLPPKSISNVISWRYKQAANALKDRGSDKRKLGERLYYDLSIIAAAVSSGKELPDVDTAIYVGEEDAHDIDGVLDLYAEGIKESGKDIVLTDPNPHVDPNSKASLDPMQVISKIKSAIGKDKTA